MRRYFTA